MPMWIKVSAPVTDQVLAPVIKAQQQEIISIFVTFEKLKETFKILILKVSTKIFFLLMH